MYNFINHSTMPKVFRWRHVSVVGHYLNPEDFNDDVPQPVLFTCPAAIYL